MASDDLRSKVLQAAIDEFADHGLSGARVDRIAQRAGANKQLIYYYFGDKEGLFDAAVRRMTDRFGEVRAQIPTKPAERPAAYFASFAEDQTFLRILQWERPRLWRSPRELLMRDLGSRRLRRSKRPEWCLPISMPRNFSCRSRHWRFIRLLSRK
jgi:AcrR family transcriptional regulator